GTCAKTFCMSFAKQKEEKEEKKEEKEENEEGKEENEEKMETREETEQNKEEENIDEKGEKIVEENEEKEEGKEEKEQEKVKKKEKGGKKKVEKKGRRMSDVSHSPLKASSSVAEKGAQDQAKKGNICPACGKAFSEGEMRLHKWNCTGEKKTEDQSSNRPHPIPCSLPPPQPVDSLPQRSTTGGVIAAQALPDGIFRCPICGVFETLNRKSVATHISRGHSEADKERYRRAHQVESTFLALPGQTQTSVAAAPSPPVSSTTDGPSTNSTRPWHSSPRQPVNNESSASSESVEPASNRLRSSMRPPVNPPNSSARPSRKRSANEDHERQSTSASSRLAKEQKKEDEQRERSSSPSPEPIDLRAVCAELTRVPPADFALPPAWRREEELTSKRNMAEERRIAREMKKDHEERRKKEEAEEEEERKRRLEEERRKKEEEEGMRLEEERRKKEEAEQEAKCQEDRRPEEENKKLEEEKKKKRGRGRPPVKKDDVIDDDDVVATLSRTPSCKGRSKKAASAINSTSTSETVHVSSETTVAVASRTPSSARGGAAKAKKNEETTTIESTSIVRDELPSASTRGGRSKTSSKNEDTTSTPVTGLPAEPTDLATPSSSRVGRSLKRKREQDEENEADKILEGSHPTTSAQAASTGGMKKETEKESASPPIKRGRKPGPKGEKKIVDKPSTSSEDGQTAHQTARASRQRVQPPADTEGKKMEQAASGTSAMHSSTAPTTTQGSASMRRLTRSGMPISKNEEEEETSPETSEDPSIASLDLPSGSGENRSSRRLSATDQELLNKQYTLRLPNKTGERRRKEEKNVKLRIEEDLRTVAPLGISATCCTISLVELRAAAAGGASTSGVSTTPEAPPSLLPRRRSDAQPPRHLPSISSPPPSVRGRKAKRNDDSHPDTPSTRHLPPPLIDEVTDQPATSTPPSRGRKQRSITPPPPVKEEMDQLTSSAPSMRGRSKKSEEHPTRSPLTTTFPSHPPSSSLRGRRALKKAKEKEEEPSTSTPKRGRKAKGEEPREEKPRESTPPPPPTKGRPTMEESERSRGRKRKQPIEEKKDAPQKKKEERKADGAKRQKK
ncbi:hypothetical protein PRIPAC_71721, partial [Pristionchus pacificus]